MKIIQIVGLTIGFALLTGCSFTTVQRAPLAIGAVQASQSRIYVYSLKGIGGKPAKISDGDTLIGDLSNHAHLCWDRAPGKTVIRARLPHGRGIWGDANAELLLDLVGGQTYYLQTGVDVPWFVVVSAGAGQAATTFTLAARSPQDGAADIARECKAPETSGK
jgi:hypothetical protein